MSRSRMGVALVVGAVLLAVLLVGFGLLLAVAAFSAFASRGGMMGGRCPWCGGLGTIGGGEIASILALLLIALFGLGLLTLFVLGAFWLARRSSRR